MLPPSRSFAPGTVDFGMHATLLNRLNRWVSVEPRQNQNKNSAPSVAPMMSATPVHIGRIWRMMQVLRAKKISAPGISACERRKFEITDGEFDITDGEFDVADDEFENHLWPIRHR
jgi:hypothetical protein